MQGRGLAFLSVEFHEDWPDNEKADAHGYVLLGGGLTTRLASRTWTRCNSASAPTPHRRHSPCRAPAPDQVPGVRHEQASAALKTKLLSLGLTEKQIRPILTAAEKQLAVQADDEAECLATVVVFEASGDMLGRRGEAPGRRAWREHHTAGCRRSGRRRCAGRSRPPARYRTRKPACCSTRRASSTKPGRRAW